MSHCELSNVSSRYGAPMGRPSDGMSAVKLTEPSVQWVNKGGLVK